MKFLVVLVCVLVAVSAFPADPQEGDSGARDKRSGLLLAAPGVVNGVW
ncbi:unnamed protein product, partial [Timema podura]|nr:unnamed protein product [Timema podura]